MNELTLERLRKEVEDNPRSGRLRMELAQAHWRLGQFRAATDVWKGAVTAGFTHPEILNNFAVALLEEGRTHEAISVLRAALVLAPTRTEVRSNFLLTLNSSDEFDPEEVACAHREFSTYCDRGVLATNFYGLEVDLNEPGDRIRIGYVSGTFRDHATVRFFEPILRAHDRTRFDVSAFSAGPVVDDVTRRLQKCFDRWHDISALNDAEAADLIRRERIGILVDLDGHTAGNRLLLFAQKPAQVQVSWLGYANTTGLPEMDYRITDSVADPPGVTDGWHSEKLIRLDPIFLAFPLIEEAPDVGPLPALRNHGNVTFACFSQLHKLSNEAVEAIAAVVCAVPNSRLLLKSRALADRQVADAIRARFLAFSISQERVLCQSFLPDRRDHLNLYNEADIALDTFPYNGTSTTCDALWMGLPVVTLEGKTHAARVGASLLKSAGLDRMVARDVREYVAIAVGLATHPAELAELRRNLRSKLAGSPLTDTERFVKRLEAAFTQMQSDQRGELLPANRLKA